MKKPNIIYILSDQHNAEVTAHWGDPWVRTPHIDRLFASGVSLENCYAPAPLCVPCRSSLLTGLLPCHTGVYNNMQSLRSDQATFVTALTVGGYETVLSGRMHFVGPDQRHGYEKRFVGDLTPSHIGADNEEEVYGAFRRSSNQSRVAIDKSGPGNSAVLDYDLDVTEAACRHIATRDDPRPLFLTVGLYGPHCPYIAPPELFREYYGKLPVPEEVGEEYRAAVHPAIRDWYALRDLEAVAADDVRRVRAAYYGMVTRTDELVGRVVAAAEAHLDMDNTLVIYGSDHGDNIGKHGLFWKTNFYEGSSRVPMGFSWRNHIPAGVRLRGISSLLDLAPTLLAVAECPPLPECDGVDLSRHLLSGEPLDADRVVLSECSDIKGDNPSAMARWGRYKLVMHATHPLPQLFDLLDDPDEMRDLAGDPAHYATVERLTEHVLRYWTPEKALRDLEIAKAHFNLMRRWVDIVKPAPIEEWRGDKKRNYLERVS